MTKRKLRVYIDTSVIGGCCEPEFAPWSLRLVRDARLGILIPVISSLTEAEMAGAPPTAFRYYAEILDLGTEFVRFDEEARSLALAYLGHGILTTRYRNDAFHVAIATVAEVDILVSWNFRHVVHFDKIRMFNGVNLEKGYRSIQIFSPREVVSYGP